ncbi:MAG: glycosyltransferase [bacterium]
MRNNGQGNQGRVRVMQLIAPNTLGGAERVVLSIQQWLGRGGEDGEVKRRENGEARGNETREEENGEYFSSTLGVFSWVKKPDNAFLREVSSRGYPHVIFPMRFAFDWANLVQLFRSLKANRIQLLHTHGYRSDILGLICARAARIPVVTTLHGWTAMDWKVRRYEDVQRWGLPFFSAIIAVSEEIKDRLIRQRGIDPGKITVLQNAVSLPHEADGWAQPADRGQIRRQFDCDPDAPVIGFVGRLSPEKNPADLLRATSLLARRIPNMLCWIVGEGPERSALENQAMSLGITQRVRFLGFQAQISRIYKALDVLAITSSTEGTPMALLEAMSWGIPVVSTRVGGIGALLEHGVDGFLVNPGDTAGLVRSLERVLSDPELAHEMGKTAREKVRVEFAMAGWIQKIRKVYRRCL